MKYLLLIWMALFSVMVLTGCTKGCSTKNIACQIEKTVIAEVAPVILDKLQCQNLDAIEKDLHQWTQGLNLCMEMKYEDRYQLPMPICSMFSNLIVNNLSKQIPSSWGCSAKDAKGTLASAITAACSNL